MNKTHDDKETQLMKSACLYFEERGWELILQEYEVFPGFSQLGRGDLLFNKGNDLIVVECKYIDINKPGKTARSKRTHHRKKVKQQSLYYAAIAKLKNSDCIVRACTFTDECPYPQSWGVVEYLDAKHTIVSSLKSMFELSSFTVSIVKAIKEGLSIPINLNKGKISQK